MGESSDVRQQFAQAFDIGRLYDVMVEPGGPRSIVIGFLSPAGQGDQQEVLMLRHRSDAAGHFVAVHLRHADIKDDRIGMEYLEQVERGTAAVRDGDRRAERGQQLSERIGGIAIVVDDQDPPIGKVAARR